MIREEEFPVATMHRICKRAGAERVSVSASAMLGKTIEEMGVKIAKEALGHAMHAGRRTVSARDIKIASSRILEKK